MNWCCDIYFAFLISHILTPSATALVRNRSYDDWLWGEPFWKIWWIFLVWASAMDKTLFVWFISNISMLLSEPPVITTSGMISIYFTNEKLCQNWENFKRLHEKNELIADMAVIDGAKVRSTCLTSLAYVPLK